MRCKSGSRVERRKARAERIILRFGLSRRIFGIALAPQRLIEIDVLLEGQGGIEHLLHGIEAVGLDVPLDLAGVARRVLDDVCVALVLAAAEQHVVLREIGVTEHVCGDQHVVREPVAGGEIRVARIAGEHHLEQPRVAHVPLQQLIDIARAEGPVRHAHRQPIDGDLGHETVGYGFEDDLGPVEPEVPREVLEPRHVSTPIRAHGVNPAGSATPLVFASAVKKCRTASAMSSAPPTEKRPHGRPDSAAASNRPMVSLRELRTPAEIST